MVHFVFENFALWCILYLKILHWVKNLRDSIAKLTWLICSEKNLSYLAAQKITVHDMKYLGTSSPRIELNELYFIALITAKDKMVQNKWKHGDVMGCKSGKRRKWKTFFFPDIIFF